MRRDEISAMLRIISDGQPSLRQERTKSSEVRFSSLKSSDVEEEEQVEEGPRTSDAPSFSEEAPLSADEVTVVTGVLGQGIMLLLLVECSMLTDCCYRCNE